MQVVVIILQKPRSVSFFFTKQLQYGFIPMEIIQYGKEELGENFWNDFLAQKQERIRFSTQGKKSLLIRTRRICGKVREGQVMCSEKQVNRQKICCELVEVLFIFIEVQPVYNVVLVSGVQQSDSVMYIYKLYIYHFSDYFPLQSLQGFKIVTSAIQFLYFIYSSIYIYIYKAQIPNLYLPPFPFVNHNFVFCVCKN